jgi:hypothetical protein
MPRYRYTTPGKTGRWCDTEREACLAAVKAGLGSVDDSYEPRPGDYPNPIYLHPLVKIEKEPDA